MFKYKEIKYDDNDKDITFKYKGINYNFNNIAKYCSLDYWDDDDVKNKNNKEYLLQKHIYILESVIKIYNEKRIKPTQNKYNTNNYNKFLEERLNDLKINPMPIDSPYYIDTNDPDLYDFSDDDI